MPSFPGSGIRDGSENTHRTPSATNPHSRIGWPGQDCVAKVKWIPGISYAGKSQTLVLGAAPACRIPRPFRDPTQEIAGAGILAVWENAKRQDLHYPLSD